VPILIVAVSEDQHAKINETKDIFQAANYPKELWIVNGAAHVNLFEFDPSTYQYRVSTFFYKYLR